MNHLRFWQKAYFLTLLLFLVSLFGGISLMGWQTQQHMRNSEMKKARSEQSFIAQNLSKDLSKIQNNLSLRVTNLASSYGKYYAQNGILLELSRDGKTIFTNLPADAKENTELLGQEGKQHWMIQDFQGTQYSIVFSSLPDGFENYTLVCARSMAPFTTMWNQMRHTLVMGSTVVSVLLAMGLFFILRGITKPLEKLTGTANQFAGGDFRVRAVKNGKDEIANLAESFNAMADAAEQNMDEIQQIAEQNARMAANLSHEIRTPLTAIQGYAEYMCLAELTDEERHDSLLYIIDESARLQKISQRMLQLFSLEHVKTEHTPIDLAKIIRQVSLSIAPKAEQSNILFEIGPVPKIEILGDDILLESLFTNLLDNAIKACTKNGKIQLDTKQDEKRIKITITDNGCGLNQKELDKLGKPFYRADKSRSSWKGGAGLGVALCYQIARLHQATLHYESVPKKGTTVTLEFTAL